MKKYIYYGVVFILVASVVYSAVFYAYGKRDTMHPEDLVLVERDVDDEYAKLWDAIIASVPKVKRDTTVTLVGEGTETKEGVGDDARLPRMEQVVAGVHSVFGFVSYGTRYVPYADNPLGWKVSIEMIFESGGEILIEDTTQFIQDHYARTGEETNQNYLSILSVPDHADVVLLRVGKRDSDASSGDIFKLNPVTKEAVPITITDAYRHWWHTPVLSPDGGKIATIPVINSEYEWEGQHTLYVLDLVQDTATLVHTLRDDETFIQDYEGIAEMPSLDVEWVDASTIKVGVFKDMEGRYEANEFLRYETITLDT